MVSTFVSGDRGAPERIRTSDPRLRRPLLYPPELLARAYHLAGASRFERPTTCAQGRCASRLRYAPSKVNEPLTRTPGPTQRWRGSGGGESGAERAHGARPVAHALLVGGRGGGEGAPQLVGHEHGIVAEPAAAARGGRDPAVARALGGHRVAPRPDEGDDAAEARAPPSARHRRQLGQETGHAGGVGRRVARRAHPGRAPERLHLEARVVGERREAGRGRHRSRLRERILQVGPARLLGAAHAREVGEREDLGRPPLRHQRAQLLELAAVGRGQHEPRRNHPRRVRSTPTARSVARWSAVSSPRPARATASRRSSCRSVNGFPSPVPRRSRSMRSPALRGSMAYSAVTQPRPWPRRKGGTLSCTVAVHTTRVAPISISADPSAGGRKPGVSLTGRSSPARRPSARRPPCPPSTIWPARPI